MADVVAITDEGHLEAFEAAKVLRQGLKVGYSLAGMIFAAQRIDDGD